MRPGSKTSSTEKACIGFRVKGEGEAAGTCAWTKQPVEV